MTEKKKTIFVLGAGASKPYGYPIGSELKKEIIDLMSDDNIGFPGLLSDLIFDGSEGLEALANENENPFLAFTNSFKKSGKFTIDEFLRTQIPFRKIGKFAIAYVLLKKEHPDNYFQDEWFQFLWNQLNRNVNRVEQIQSTNIGFITFNYDLSIEHILYEAVKNTFPGVADSDVRKVFDGIPIVHVHGKIKKLPWEDVDKNNFEKFGLTGLELNEVMHMSEGIKLVHEDEENKELFKVKQLISAAENIVFLGFGFHQDNVIKLNETRTEWVEQKLPSRPLNTQSRMRGYTNPVSSSFRAVKNPVTVNHTRVQVSVFSGKKLYATGIKMAESDRADAKKILGLNSLKFENHSSINDFLKTYASALL